MVRPGALSVSVVGPSQEVSAKKLGSMLVIMIFAPYTHKETFPE